MMGKARRCEGAQGEQFSRLYLLYLQTLTFYTVDLFLNIIFYSSKNTLQGTKPTYFTMRMISQIWSQTFVVHFDTNKIR